MLRQKSSISGIYLLYSLAGGLVAGYWFILLALITIVLDNNGPKILEFGSSRINYDAVLYIFWPAAHVCGFLGAMGLLSWKKLFHSQPRPRARVVYGSLAGMLLVWLFMLGFTFRNTKAASPSLEIKYTYEKLTSYKYIDAEAFTPDGRMMAIGYESVFLWNIEGTPTRQKELQSSIGAVFSLSFSPDGNWLLAGGFKAPYAILWSIPGGEIIYQLEGIGDHVVQTAISPDNRLAATADSDGVVNLWDMQSGKRVNSFTIPHVEINELRFTPDSRYIAAAFTKYENCDTISPDFALFDISGAEAIRYINFQEAEATCGAQSISFSPDGRIIAGLTDYGPVLWDLQAGTKIKEIAAVISGFPTIDFSPDGKQLLYTRPDSIHIVDALSLSQVGELRGLRADYIHAKYLADGRIAATYISIMGFDEIGLWTPSTP